MYASFLILFACHQADPDKGSDQEVVIDDPVADLAPVADDDDVTVSSGGEVLIAVTANDRDPEDALVPESVQIAEPPSHGTVEVGVDGEVTYTHDGAGVEDSFTYTVADAAGQRSNVARVGIAVAPDETAIAVDDLVVVDEGQAITFDVLANDRGALDVASLVSASRPPEHGTIAPASPGSLTYTHDGSETTSDVISYQVRDTGGGLSNVARVTIEVRPINDPPAAVDDAATLVPGGVSAVGVAANDVDAEGALDSASIQVISAPASGSLTVRPDGTVDYLHDGVGVGPDAFTYRIADVDGAWSNTATVHLTELPAAPCGPLVLDPTLGSDGTVNLITPGTDYDDGAYAAARQADGRLVVAGRYYRTAYGRTANFTRLLADGTLDPTFGGDGFADALFTVSSSIYGLAIEPDDLIVAAGDHGGALLVLRLDPDGSFDAAFGVGGTVVVPSVTVAYDSHRMVALQPDGRIVAVGNAGADIAVVRLLDDGTADPTFGVAGVAVLDLGASDTAYTVALQPDGRILVAGAAGADFGVARLLSDGTPDSAFGVGGVAVADVTGAQDYAYGLAVLPDGDVVAVGCGDCTFDYLHDGGWALARFGPDGVLDASFGAGGLRYDPIPAGLLGGTGHNDRAWAVAPVADGLLVVGQAQWNDSFGRMLIARYLDDGQLDTCFDGDGYYTQDRWDVGSQGDAAHEVLVEGDGSFVVVGAVNPSASGAQGVMQTLP